MFNRTCAVFAAVSYKTIFSYFFVALTMLTCMFFIQESRMAQQRLEQSETFTSVAPAVQPDAELTITLNANTVDVKNNKITSQQVLIHQKDLSFPLLDVDGVTIELDRARFKEGIAGINLIKLGEIKATATREGDTNNLTRLLSLVMDTINTLTAGTPKTEEKNETQPFLAVDMIELDPVNVDLFLGPENDLSNMPLSVNSILIDGTKNTITISQVGIKNPITFGGNLVTVDQLALGFDLNALLNGKLIIEDLNINKPLLSLFLREQSHTSNAIFLNKYYKTLIPKLPTSPQASDTTNDKPGIAITELIPDTYLNNIDLAIHLGRGETQRTLNMSLATTGVSVKQGEAGLTEFKLAQIPGYQNDQFLSLSEGLASIKLEDVLNGVYELQYLQAGDLVLNIEQNNTENNISKLLGIAMPYVDAFTQSLASDKPAKTETPSPAENTKLPVRILKADRVTANVAIHPNEINERSQTARFKLSLAGADIDFPGNQLELNNLNIGNAPFFEQPFLADVSGVTVKMQSDTLLSDHIIIDEIKIDKMEIYYEQYGNKINVEHLVKYLLAINVQSPALSNSSEGSDQTTDFANQEKSITIKRIYFNDVDVNIKIGDGKNQLIDDMQPFELTDLKVSGTNKDLPFQILIQMIPPITQVVFTNLGDKVPSLMVDTIGNTFNILDGGIEDIGTGLDDAGRGLENLIQGGNNSEENKKPETNNAIRAVTTPIKKIQDSSGNNSQSSTNNPTETVTDGVENATEGITDGVEDAAEGIRNLFE